MIAIVGEALVDVQFEGDVLRHFPGGGPFNTAVALAHLGVPTQFLGALSRDGFGQLLEHTLRSAGLDTGDVVRTDALTPIALVDSTGAEPGWISSIRPPRRMRCSPRLRGEGFGRVSARCTWGRLLWPPTLRARRSWSWRRARRSAACSLSTRTSDRQRSTTAVPISPTLTSTRIAGVVKLSTSDMAWLYPERSVRDGARCLLEQGAMCAVVTRGADGAQAWIDSGTAQTFAVPVTVADTIGAGDAFCAGLLAWLRKSDRLSVRSLRNLALAGSGRRSPMQPQSPGRSAHERRRGGRQH